MHHVLLAHGLSMRALRDAGVTGDRGIILSLSGVRAATDHPDDQAAADRAALFAEKIFLDPLLGRGHIEPVAKLLSTQGVLLEGDEEIIGTPAELIGLNWYSTFGAAAPSRATPMLEDAPRQWAMFAKLAESTEPLGFAIVPIPGAGWMHAHRQLTPGGMRAMLDWVHTEYPELPPIVVTENGIGLRDPIEPDGTIPDTQRIDYMSRALSEIASAIDAGIDVRGYYAWSFIDNLQWNAGFTHRFGLIHVDPVTLVRTPKQSFAWFARVIESNVLEPLLEPVDVAKAVSLGAVENARGLEGLRTVTGRAVRPGLFVRSGALHRLDARSNYELEQLNVTTVIDLRTDAERTGHPSMLSESTRVVHIPLLSDLNAHVESGAMDLASVYEGMIEHRGDALVAVLQEVIGARDAVLVHCTAGKDRTGVVVALLLALLGVGDEAIIANYAESESRLSERFRRDVEALMQQLGGSDALRTTALESPPVLLESLFARIRSQHGSITAYLRAHGLTDEHIARARDKFLEPVAA
ncbi:family 1 glycosylhydrolase [Humidisolicoccus flavus]|uniref:family 1 glycosylhydrolase n=1 Tax=Humidisolicoccus flavus TaxID=3111414 RepID=UPI00324511FC